MVTSCIFWNKTKWEQEMEKGKKNGGILTYGESKREQKKAEQNVVNRLQKENYALKKPRDVGSK